MLRRDAGAGAGMRMRTAPCNCRRGRNANLFSTDWRARRPHVYMSGAGAGVHLPVTSRALRSLINTINSSPRAFEANTQLFPLHWMNTRIIWDTAVLSFSFCV